MIIKRLHPSSFRENVNTLADLLAAEPLSPLQKATWLVEYVAKTRGAEHLKLPSRKLNLLQFVGADILSFVTIFSALGILAVIRTVRKVSSFVHYLHGYVSSKNKSTSSNVQQVQEKKRQ